LSDKVHDLNEALNDAGIIISDLKATLAKQNIEVFV